MSLRSGFQRPKRKHSRSLKKIIVESGWPGLLDVDQCPETARRDRMRLVTALQVQPW
jgi:hypothetical protein